MDSVPTFRVVTPNPRKAGKVLLGLAVIASGFYLATYLFLWMLGGGGAPPPPPEWWTPILVVSTLFLFISVIIISPIGAVFLAPLIIAPMVTIALTVYLTRNGIWRDFLPRPATPTIRLSRTTGRRWLRTRLASLPIVLLAPTIGFFPLTFALDYASVHSISVGLSINGTQASSNPPEINFSVSLYFGNPQSGSQSVRVTQTRVSLVVDSLQAGSQLVPLDSTVGGIDYRDAFYDLKFNMSGGDAATVLAHSQPNYITLTVEFVATTVLYQVKITQTQPSLYYAHVNS